MRIFPKLALGFGVVVATLCGTGALVVSNLEVLRATGNRVRDRVSFSEIALEYRQGAENATLGAAQLASGSPMGEQRLREGTRTMAHSRAQLKVRARGAEALELVELERLEGLTVAATSRVVSHVRARSPVAIVQQDLAFLSARSDALNLRLEALADDTREETTATMAVADAIGARVQRQTIGAVLACILFSMFVAIFVSRSIARPVAHLEKGVRRIGGGDLEHAIEVTSRDEIGQLTKAFNDMTRGLRETMSTLDGRNRDMRLVFDNVAQGLVTMSHDGTLSKERSAVVDTWLGEIPQERPLWTHFDELDRRFAPSLRLASESLFEDDWMPLELRLENAPKKARVGVRHLEFDYRPILNGEVVEKLLVIVSDVSERVVQEKARAEEQEVLAIFQATQKDKQGFLDFFAEGDRLILSLSEPDLDLVTLKRHVHTIKGNSGLYGITSIATVCHELETAMEDEERAPRPAELERLGARWADVAALVRRLVGEASTTIEVETSDVDDVLESLVGGTPRSEIARRVARWRMDPAEVRLARLGEQARTLADRLGKSPVEVKVESSGVRLPRETFASFWGAFVHVVRNAVDHGLEPSERRREAGKSDNATLTLRTCVIGDELSIEVEDNGRGVPWERIAEKARERGLPAETADDLVQALFSDGVSTAEAVTDVSGRGVGMAAVRDACARLGGRITIDSVLGQGTRVAFRFPASVVDGDAGAPASHDQHASERTSVRAMTSSGVMPSVRAMPHELASAPTRLAGS
jgi:two-component system chemotaxis sensor kinase CheA